MKFIQQIKLEKKFLVEAISFWLKTRRYNASNHTEYDMEKMQYVLSRQTHTIEKGLSLRNPRKGFGQNKVEKLLDDMNNYVTMYYSADKEFVRYPIDTIAHYIEYTKSFGVNIQCIEEKFNKLIIRTGILPNKTRGGVISIYKQDIISSCHSSFKELMESRHSVRYFSNIVPKKDIIDKALEIAQRTPSACNRQGWKTHVFLGDKSVELVKWQGGAHGFEEEIKGTILVTANLKAFLYYEVHQSYIDGGLYAMNLINSLHSLGLGTIPLSLGFESEKLNTLRHFGIPDNETPILIIGFGYLEDTFKVAISERKNITLTNTYH